MEDFKSVFDMAAQLAAKNPNYENDFKEFRSHPELFHFIMAPEHLINPDTISLVLAYDIDLGIFQYLFKKGPSRLGGGPDKIDAVECRHILMMTFLISKLGNSWGNVLEIGGGYGNCLRLVNGLVNFTNWTIVDLGYILKLQQWFLRENGITDVTFIDNTEFLYDLQPDVVIGTHSLSEISLDDFLSYFHTIKKSKWLFYVAHSSSPSPKLLADKLTIILKHFMLEDILFYEDNQSAMFLFKSLGEI